MARGTPESFKNKTGMQVSDFVSSIITWLAGRQRGFKQAMAIGIRKSHAVVIVACLDFIETSLRRGAMNVDPLRALVNIVKEYSRVSCQVLQLDSPPRSADDRQSAVSLLFSVAALLAGTTNVIPTSCPSDILQVNSIQTQKRMFADTTRYTTLTKSYVSCSPILQGIALTYKMLFETNAWPIVARTVTSLVQFASTIPSAHQGILPECIPTDSQGLLQCRLQGLVYRDADSHKVSLSLCGYCSSFSCRCITRLTLVCVLFNRNRNRLQ